MREQFKSMKARWDNENRPSARSRSSREQWEKSIRRLKGRGAVELNKAAELNTESCPASEGAGGGGSLAETGKRILLRV
jgi:hypothetical protein